MHKTRAEARAYTTALTEWLGAAGLDATIFVMPPFTALAEVCELARGSTLKVGAQNMHWADEGAYTGEISPVLIKDCGAELVELGHFERRTQFGETDPAVNKQVHAALAHGLVPVLCVGETEAERDYGVAASVVARQVTIALHDVPPDRVADVVLAYEPGWAIGEGGSDASPEYVNAQHSRIREVIAERHGEAAAAGVRVLYGGSVTARNAGPLAAQPQVAGLFIGRAAWDVDSFLEIIRLVTA
jgi:triosephosphate isomerase